MGCRTSQPIAVGGVADGDVDGVQPSDASGGSMPAAAGAPQPPAGGGNRSVSLAGVRALMTASKRRRGPDGAPLPPPLAPSAPSSLGSFSSLRDILPSANARTPNVAGTTPGDRYSFYAIRDKYETLEDVTDGLRGAGAWARAWQVAVWSPR